MPFFHLFCYPPLLSLSPLIVTAVSHVVTILRREESHVCLSSITPQVACCQISFGTKCKLELKNARAEILII